jgi:hypothetical protein
MRHPVDHGKERVMNRAVICLALLALPASVSADVPHLAAGWDRVDFQQTEACTGEVRGNGQMFRIAVSGLQPNGQGQFFLTNGSIVPIDWTVQVDGFGQWQTFYLPFHWQSDSGTVQAAFTSGDCRLALSFPWDVRNRTID